MAVASSLATFTEAIADAVPAVDRVTTGQYGDGLDTEDEERQLELLLDRLREADTHYEEVDREVPYPDGSGTCDLMLPNGMAVEAKLIATGGRTATRNPPCTATCSVRSTGTRS